MSKGAPVPDQAVAALPDISTPKVAHVGTQMLRRSDVRAATLKIKAYAIRALQLAKEEGRWQDVDLCLAKVRTATAIVNEILDACPVFINAQAIEARSAETVEDESAAPERGAP